MKFGNSKSPKFGAVTLGSQARWEWVPSSSFITILFQVSQIFQHSYPLNLFFCILQLCFSVIYLRMYCTVCLIKADIFKGLKSWGLLAASPLPPLPQQCGACGWMRVRGGRVGEGSGSGKKAPGHCLTPQWVLGLPKGRKRLSKQRNYMWGLPRATYVSYLARATGGEYISREIN